MTFPEWLEEKLDERGWSVEEFASRANLSKTEAEQILKEGRPLSAEALAKIAQAFGFPLETIYRAANILPAKEKETPALNQVQVSEPSKPAQPEKPIQPSAWKSGAKASAVLTALYLIDRL